MQERPFCSAANCRLQKLQCTKKSRHQHIFSKARPAGHRLGGCRRRGRPLQRSPHLPNCRGPLWPAAVVRQHMAPLAAGVQMPMQEPAPHNKHSRDPALSISMPPFPRHVPMCCDLTMDPSLQILLYFLHAAHLHVEQCKAYILCSIGRCYLGSLLALAADKNKIGNTFGCEHG